MWQRMHVSVLWDSYSKCPNNVLCGTFELTMPSSRRRAQGRWGIHLCHIKYQKKRNEIPCKKRHLWSLIHRDVNVEVMARFLTLGGTECSSGTGRSIASRDSWTAFASSLIEQQIIYHTDIIKRDLPLFKSHSKQPNPACANLLSYVCCDICIEFTAALKLTKSNSTKMFSKLQSWVVRWKSPKVFVAWSRVDLVPDHNLSFNFLTSYVNVSFCSLWMIFSQILIVSRVTDLVNKKAAAYMCSSPVPPQLFCSN